MVTCSPLALLHFLLSRSLKIRAECASAVYIYIYSVEGCIYKSPAIIAENHNKAQASRSAAAATRKSSPGIYKRGRGRCSIVLSASVLLAGNKSPSSILYIYTLRGNPWLVLAHFPPLSPSFYGVCPGEAALLWGIPD